jgi:hypothetical protein
MLLSALTPAEQLREAKRQVERSQCLLAAAQYEHQAAVARLERLEKRLAEEWAGVDG